MVTKKSASGPTLILLLYRKRVDREENKEKEKGDTSVDNEIEMD